MAPQTQKNKMKTMGTRYYQRKTKNIFYQFLSLALGFLSLFLILGFNLYPKLLLIWRSVLGRLEADCGCTHHLSFANHPFLFSSLILTGAGVLLLCVFLMITFVRTREATRRFIKGSLQGKQTKLSFKLKKAARAIQLDKKIIEASASRPFIFCFNFFKPKICVSTALVKRLSPTELTAVLLHEQYHLSVYAPIKLFIVKILDKILFFIPGLRLLAKQYLTLSELAADEYATNSFREKAPLAQALCKMLAWERRIVLKNDPAVSFFGAILEARVDQLTNNEYTPHLKIFTPKLILNVALIFLLFFVLNIFLDSQSFAFANPAYLPCAASQAEINQCNMGARANCTMADRLDEHSCEGMQ